MVKSMGQNKEDSYINNKKTSFLSISDQFRLILYFVIVFLEGHCLDYLKIKYWHRHFFFHFCFSVDTKETFAYIVFASVIEQLSFKHW